MESIKEMIKMIFEFTTAWGKFVSEVKKKKREEKLEQK